MPVDLGMVMSKASDVVSADRTLDYNRCDLGVPQRSLAEEPGQGH